jgi:hypothetical protein
MLAKLSQSTAGQLRHVITFWPLRELFAQEQIELTRCTYKGGMKEQASCFIFIRADTCAPPFQLGPITSPTGRFPSWRIAGLLAGSLWPPAYAPCCS